MLRVDHPQLRWGKISNGQSLAFSERNQLSQAIPQFHVERISHQQTPIARFESQRNVRRVYEDQILVCFFGGGYDRQRTLVQDSNRNDNSRKRFCDNYRVISPI